MKADSNHFGVVGAALPALDAVVVEGRLHGLVQALVAQHIYLFVLDLRRQRVLSLLNQLANMLDLRWLHLVPGHAARGAVGVGQHGLALEVDEVSARQVDVPFRGVEQQLQADWTIRLRVVGNALVVLVGIGYAVSAGRAVRYLFPRAPAAHLAVVLAYFNRTQWNISLTFLGLLSYSRQGMQVYSANLVLHLRQASEGACTSWQMRHLTFYTFSNCMRSTWQPFLNWKTSSWHSLQG
jgi:hypothetical protein